MNCRECGIALTESNWYASSRELGDHICIPCARRNRRIAGYKWRPMIKLTVLSHYSGGNPPHCANPFDQHKEPYTDIRALTIDHINGGGLRHLKSLHIGSGSHFYGWLRANRFPDGYQVLCFNCQWIKRAVRHETSGLDPSERNQ